MRHLPQAEAEGERPQGGESDRQRTAATPRQPAEHPEQRREYEIELLLHRQRPGMQQRRHPRADIEIARVAPEEDVGERKCRRHHALGKELQVERQEEGRTERCTDHHDEQRRQDAPRPPRVEADDAETPLQQVAVQGGGDQIARDDEEHVHADETARDARYARMERHHERDGERPQAVDVGAVAGQRPLRRRRREAQYRSVGLLQASRAWPAQDPVGSRAPAG